MAYIKVNVTDEGLTPYQRLELERSLDMVLSRLRQDFGVTTVLDVSGSTLSEAISTALAEEDGAPERSVA